MLTGGRGPMGVSSGVAVQLTAEVMGLGPRYNVCVSLCNNANKTVLGLQLLLHCNQDMYSCKQAVQAIDVLLPVSKLHTSLHVANGAHVAKKWLGSCIIKKKSFQPAGRLCSALQWCPKPLLGACRRSCALHSVTAKRRFTPIALTSACVIMVVWRECTARAWW